MTLAQGERWAGQQFFSWCELRITERELTILLADQHVWNELYPAEQARIVQLLVARVVVRQDGLEISLRVEGITSVIEDLRLRVNMERQAA